MGSVGNQKTTSESNETVKGLIFGNARIIDTFIDIDGYSNKKTEKGMLNELAKAIEKYDKGEADAVRDMIKFNEINQVPPSRDSQYLLEWEEVSAAYDYKTEDEYDIKPAKWYVHIRFYR